MESATLLLEIHVHCEKPLEVQGHSKRVVFIPFTATASGPDFEGEVVGPGVDTQIYDLDGAGGLSARYILRG